MKDQFAREIDYLRISVTDRCNLRCTYCMPAEGMQTVPMQEVLTYEEIARACRIGAELGIRKVKLTGGEPLVRKGLCDLVGMISEIPGIEEVTLTTNGILLRQQLGDLMRSGLGAVNISLDTLDPKEFQEITRFDALEQVLDGITCAWKSGIRTKINTVLREGCDWKRILGLAKTYPLDVRFIELMPIGESKGERGISAEELLKNLRELYPQMAADPEVHGNGPAEYYRIPSFAGSIGIIHAIHGKFCHDCNRIRLTATGQLKPCLCYKTTYDFRQALREGDDEAAREVFRQAIFAKPEAHCFEKPEEITEAKNMVSIGG